MTTPDPYPLHESVSVQLGGWNAVSGSQTAPPAFTTLCTTAPIVAGTYTVNWTVTLAGTPGANEVNNFRLVQVNPLQFIMNSVNPGANGSYPQAPAVVTIPQGASLIVSSSGNAGSAGAVYTGAITGQGGNGIARISPGLPGAPGSGVGASRNSGLTWNLAGVAVSAATNQAEASCSVYVSYGIQSATAADLQGTTQMGSTGDTCTCTATLKPGDWITVVWTGGDPGAVATARIFGSVTPPGVR